MAEKEAETIDLESLRPHGKWEYWPGWVGNTAQRIDDAKCSECGFKHPMVYRRKEDKPNSTPDKLYNYCPNCGAKMEG